MAGLTGRTAAWRSEGQSPQWAGNVDLAGGASGKIMQRRRMSGSCP